MTVRETLAFSARVQGVGAGHVIKMLGKSMKILEVDKRSLMLSSSLTVAVAVNGSRKSNCALKWALERFSDEGKVTTVPTPNEYFNSRMPIVVKGITQGGCESRSSSFDSDDPLRPPATRTCKFRGLYHLDETWHEIGRGEPVDGEIQIEKCKINVRVGLLSDIRVTKRSTHRGFLK
ncbi:hypothetical protein Sjap_026235 [Stephania japonica]|uniref:Uncharacterized protein n=1 Tax=Stephania japonica TaxID=461633 RepID=A0AAP0EB24_9MAGN